MEDKCLSVCFFFAEKRHNDQGNLYNKAFKWGLLAVSESVHYHHGGEGSIRQAVGTREVSECSHLILRIQAERVWCGLWTPQQPPPPIVTQLIIVPKHF